MTVLEANKAYYLHENVTGAEDLGCRFSFTWREDALEFLFDVKDEDVISPYQADNEDVWKGDAVEVFLSPNGSRERYYELEVSPFGVRFWADVVNRPARALRVKKLPPPFAAQAERTAYGYTVRICLPLSAMKKFDKEKFLMNAFRIDRKESGEQKLYALSPTRCATFHKTEYFIGTGR